MTWQDELRRLDTALAAGDISQSEHQEQRDAVLSIAAGSRAGSPFDTQLTLRNQPISAIKANTAAADQLDPASPAPVMAAADEPTPTAPAETDGDTPSAAESVAPEAEQKTAEQPSAEQKTVEQGATEQPTTEAGEKADSTPKPAAEPPPAETTSVTPLPAGPPTMTTPPTSADSSSVSTTTGVPMAGSTAPTSKQGTTDESADAGGQTLGARLGAVMQDHPNVHQSDQDSLPLPMTTDTMARPGPYAGRAEEVFNAQSARPRRKLVLPIVLTVLLLAVIAAGVVWFMSNQSTADDTQQDVNQSQPQDNAPPPAAGDQPTLPTLPGEPVPHPEAMSRDAAVTAGVLGETEAEVFGEHDVTEILFRGSADAGNSFGVLVGVAPSEDAALASAEALAFGQTELGLEAVAMEELPGQVRVFEQVGEEQSIYRAVYVSGVHVVRLGVAGPTNNEAAPVDAAFRTLADETLQTLEQN
ncbi:hypothetical protein [Actinoalloteichus hymeniacidonis]|uniref:Uncharacterized protein n=1 Tax=Actinoalloteichus hymeniacidonis TaxID=340345 RepID=A0AAC9MWB9_9PSEU|nr:hypothetical protein [Actinoalloteichus hymeniacidonis]AOS60914.1 hypothetical protein TL08_00325 [Actinoalloteichus hymeniacidonis]MBB5911086.1 outer membrane biosynthesis protein TonB [Actinoalloteichus hymeniacidonis]